MEQQNSSQSFARRNKTGTRTLDDLFQDQITEGLLEWEENSNANEKSFLGEDEDDQQESEPIVDSDPGLVWKFLVIGTCSMAPFNGLIMIYSWLNTQIPGYDIPFVEQLL